MHHRQVLVIQGFLAARRQRHRMVDLVRLMAACTRPAAWATAPPPADASPPLQPVPALPDAAAPLSGSAPPPLPPDAGCAPSWPCFRAGGDRAAAALEARFVPRLNEEDCVGHVLGLISASLDAWSTRQYDAYQRLLNGIL